MNAWGMHMHVLGSCFRKTGLIGLYETGDNLWEKKERRDHDKYVTLKWRQESALLGEKWLISGGKWRGYLSSFWCLGYKTPSIYMCVCAHKSSQTSEKL